jgi:hypothetical protein
MTKKEAVSTEPYKGVRDFYPEDQFLQDYLFGHMRDACELFGYEEYNASVLEPSELYRSKTSDEIVNELYQMFEMVSNLYIAVSFIRCMRTVLSTLQSFVKVQQLLEMC